MLGPVAVADTSVLIALHHLGLLPKLSMFYSQVLVPSAVRTEFLLKDEEKTREVALTLLISRAFFFPCDDYDTVQVNLYLLHRLGRGEAEALSQLRIRNADVILIDERRGRTIAERERLKVRGTIALLASLDKLGFVDAWESVRRLRAELHFRVTDKVVKEALRNPSLDS